MSLDPSLCSATFAIGPSTGGVAGGMPPGTAFLYAFDHGTDSIFLDGFESGTLDRWTTPTD